MTLWNAHGFEDIIIMLCSILHVLYYCFIKSSYNNSAFSVNTGNCFIEDAPDKDTVLRFYTAVTSSKVAVLM